MYTTLVNLNLKHDTTVNEELAPGPFTATLSRRQKPSRVTN